ncbi:MAG TPA: efflux RND transporter permease subunit [Thiotrichaceae bacterium]|jgi:multidrug efflux pump subunit AcrB|nr:efflux RND transporter permease subunit [Thiotrichaceae bacterium]HIM08196.1 efflux RND transporter permease subunit [Gammaproteobacteria bacterium]
MNLTAAAIEKKTVSYFAFVLIFIAGIAAFLSLGQLEDPDFTVKTAAITTYYPGASAEEVELEVTDRIELAIQQMKQIDYIKSWSRSGVSVIKVNIIPAYTADKIPQIWDELRRKIREVETSLPSGVGRPMVNDDFGDVFGHLLALTGDGYTYAELEEYAKNLKKELSLVDGVAKVVFWGQQKKVIYIDSSQTQISQLGLSETNVAATLAHHHEVVDSGYVDVQNKRLRITPTGEFQSPEEIADLTIRASADNSELIRIKDIGTVSQGYQNPPAKIMRFNGERAIAIAISNIPGTNVVTMGHKVADRLDELIAELPIGIEVQRVHWQADIVDASIQGFFINLTEAILIVLVVLAASMGLRMGIIIGTALILTILGTFIIMSMMGIDLQRMSLGALVIALGMMVDNSIVVADGFVSRLQKGMDRTKAAIEAATLPSMPLLGATVVAVMAFYPIIASTESVGEYCGSLFMVVGISLMFSWVLSVTLTPIQCMDMMPDPKPGEAGIDPYGAKFYVYYRSLLHIAIKRRWVTIGAMVVLLVVSIIGFGQVKQLFFPDSSMTKFMVDYWTPEGTRIQDVSADIKIIEKKLLNDERVASISTFIGGGPPRFYLPVTPEDPNQAYGQLIVNMHDEKEIDDLIKDLTPWFEETFPDAQVPMIKYGVGPAETWKLQARISGPAVADAAVLRSLAIKSTDILDAEPLVGMSQTDWRQRVLKLVPEYNQERGRWTNITRQDIGDTTKRAYDGRVIGQYRDKDDVLPIIMRMGEEERRNVGGLDVLQVQPQGATYTVPLSQVTDAVLTEWEDSVIWRRDRRRTITIQANPILEVTLPSVMKNVAEKLESSELPVGYTFEWGGEIESAAASQKSLIPGMIPAAVVIAFIVVALFNAFRPPIVIALTIPFALIGITWGLLFSGAAFGFVALLGGMSLVGMMIKNAVVLLDQVNIELAEGKTPYEAIVHSGLSRLRPVGLAAATTVLGVIPLLQDVFWVGMGVTIMAGLSFGTILTMVLVPVLYATLYKIKAPS